MNPGVEEVSEIFLGSFEYKLQKFHLYDKIGRPKKSPKPRDESSEEDTEENDENDENDDDNDSDS